MPLVDGKPVDRVPPPVVDSTATRPQGWQIRFTEEIFDDYDKYLERIALYRRPIWTCAASGQQGLTYEQALLSERAEYHRTTGIGFSDALICQMLTFISQSRLPISQAIDALYYRFLYDFFLGEHLDVKYPDTQGAMYECVVVHVGMLPVRRMDHQQMQVEQQQTGPQIAIERLGSAAADIIAMEERQARLFTVRLFDMDGNPIDDSDITVPASELSRSRNVFTKVALRQFLDAHTERGSRPGSPWIVRHEWRERFRIPYVYQGQAQMLRGSRAPTTMQRAPSSQASDLSMAEPPAVPATMNGGMAIAQLLNTVEAVVDPRADERLLLVKPFRRLPIEDLDFVQYNHIKNRAGILWALRDKDDKLPAPHKITDFFPTANTDADASTPPPPVAEELAHRWPIPVTAWQVPVPMVSRTLATYMFISCFSTPLDLNPYPLDYFETALVHNLPPSPPANDDPSATDDSTMATATGTVTATATFSSVYRETAIALLNSIIADRKRGPLPSNVESRVALMVDYQNENMSDQEEEKEEEKPEEKPANDENAMDVDEPPKPVELPPKPKVSKPVPAAPPKPLIAPRLGARSAKLRANRTIAQQFHSDEAPKESAFAGRRTRTRLSRLQYSSTMATGVSSTDDASSESEEEEEEAVVVKKRRGRPPKVKAVTPPPPPVESESESESDVVIDDDATMEGESVPEPPMDLTGMRGHKLIRHLSRTWATAPVTEATWITALIGWINEASYDYQDLLAIYESLWADRTVTANALEHQLWQSLSLEQRLVVLELLVGESTNNESIRDYLEQCAELTADLKRERLEVRREAKKIAESLVALDRADAADMLTGIHPEMSEDGLLRSREKGRKEKEEEQRRQKERRRLGESERSVARRLDHIERELRKHNIGRLTPLGMDRFYSRYYFLDGVGGCPLTGGAGRIFVQPATADDCADALARVPKFVRSVWALELPATWTATDVVLDPASEEYRLRALAFPNPSDRTVDEELASMRGREDMWGYYATTQQLEALKKWLDPRGKRESALLAELDLLQAYVSGSIRKRCQTLDQSFMVRQRHREHICDQISTLMESSDNDDADALAVLQQELAEFDRCQIPRSLLPPHRLVAEIELAGEIGAGISRSSSAANNNNGNAAAAGGNGTLVGDSAMSTTGYSSRASSVEPPSSADGLARKLTGKPGRGRRPKYRANANRTYLDDFLAYENKQVV